MDRRRLYSLTGLFMPYSASVAADVASRNDRFTSDINLKVDGGKRPWPDLWWLLSRVTEAIQGT